MNIGLMLIVWLLLTLFITIKSLLYMIQGQPFPLSQLWLMLFMWGIITIALLFFIILRKRTQHQYAKDFKHQFNNDDLYYREGEYFFQLPLIITDHLYVPIHSNYDVFYESIFNNKFQKWLSVLNFFSWHGVKLTSDRHSVTVKRKKLFTMHPRYNVYLDHDYVGTLQMQKLIKDKGIGQQLPYIFKTKKENYKFKNPYFSSKTTILSQKGKLLEANRSLFDFRKHATTKKRGEQHKVYIKSDMRRKFPDILWLAIYIQVMFNKQFQQNL